MSIVVFWILISIIITSIVVISFLYSSNSIKKILPIEKSETVIKKESKILILTDELKNKIKLFYIKIVNLFINNKFDELDGICNRNLILNFHKNVNIIPFVLQIKKIKQQDETLTIEIISRDINGNIFYDIWEILFENNKLFLLNIIGE